MDNDERLRRLRSMLNQVSGSSLESLPRPASALEAAGLGDDHIDRGLEKLANGRLDQIEPSEQFVLEAIVLPKVRPVVFITGDSTYEDLPDPWQSLNAPPLKRRLGALFQCIGRVELPNSPLVPYAGTAFIAGNGRLITNRHVAQLFAQGLGTTISYRPGGSAIDFKRQKDTPESDSHPLTVEGVELIHPYWDMAILKVAGLPSGQMLSLSAKTPEALVDSDVIVVGYPARDSRNDLKVQDEVFKGVYNVKRLQPGKVRPRAKIQSFETLVNAMTHDASTLGGNSGSAVIDVSTGEIVSLHFGGIYLKANYAVPMYELARDPRVASKLNFDGQVSSTTDFDAAWQRTQSSETPAPRPKPGPATPAVTTSARAATASTTFQIPVTVSVTVGSPVPSGAQAGETPAGEAVEEAVVIDQDYSTRHGYDPNFLDGLAVPLPKISAGMKKDTAVVRDEEQKHGDPFELTYFNYSVYMNKKRRTAWFSAANVDGDQRPNIGKRSGDRWYRDTRIDPSEQLDQKAFEPGIDRGHLTRREDTAWGPDAESALASNNDTFHFTNCSLQASAFNRGKDRWQGLEQFLLEQHAKKDHRRMTVITGPVFSDKDPVYRNEKMDQSVRCPLEFWKVCVLIRQDGSPSATAFVLGQDDIQSLPGFEEAFDVGATQITIAELEDKTGLSFGGLKRFDHFAQSNVPGTLEAVAGLEAAGRPRRPIRQPSDVVVDPASKPPAGAEGQSHKIEHVIVLMLENRSFDHLFGFAEPPAGQTLDNLLPLNPLPSNLLDPSKPRSATNPAFDVSQPAPFAVTDKQGPSHSFNAVNTQLSGFKQGPSASHPVRNNGFALNYSNSLSAHSHNVSREQIAEVMQCFSPDQLPAINQLAQAFCLCDHWHCEVPGPTMPNRMFVHAATSEGYVHNNFKRPYTSRTIYELVQEKGLTWGVYFHDLNEVMQFHALEQTPDTFRRFDRWAQDAASGNIPNYVFICPRFLNSRHGAHGESQPANSQHAPEDVRFADNLIADVYDALAANQELFGKSALIVTYDEHGGFYDHVAPGATVNPDGQNSPNPDDDPQFASFKFAFDRIGLRVPAIIASPWIDKGTVEHRMLQHTSIIKTTTEIFGLAGPLNHRDASAASFADLFGRLQQPRPASDMPASLDRPALENVTESVVAGIALDRSSEPLDDLTEGWAKAMPLHIRGTLVTEATIGVEPDIQTQGEAADLIEARLKAAGL
jgi:DNA/RNA endonuclease G (NUC1)/phospholipase C